MSTAQTEAIWTAADCTLLRYDDDPVQAVIVNLRDPFGYLATGEYLNLTSARRAAKRCVRKPEYRETYIVTRGVGESFDAERIV